MRVMRVLTRPNLGGPTRQAIALWREHQRLGVQTLLVTGEVQRGEVELSPAAHGVLRLEREAVLCMGRAAAGWVVVPELGRSVQPLGDRRAARRLRELIGSFAPDVVHTHTSKAGWLGRRAAFACGVPVTAHTFHGLVLRDYFGPIGSWWLRRLERSLARRTGLLFAVSGSCRDELAELGVAPAGRVTVLPPAVAVPELLPRGEARRALGIGQGERRALFVGRDAGVKRVEHFAAAIAAAPAWIGDVVGLQVYPARFLDPARATAGRLQLRGPDDMISSKLAAYDALVLPSRREGMPLVAIEAFAAGVPVIGYDVPGVRDALAEGRGVLVPEAAGPAGLAAALSRLADGDVPDPAAGRALVGECAPAAVAARLLAAYEAARS